MLQRNTRGFASLFFAVGLLLSSGASALNIPLGNIFNGDTPASTTPYLTVDFADVAPGTVTLTLTSSLDVLSEYIHEVAFNIDPSIVPSSIGIAQGSGPTATVSSGAQDAQNMMGTGVSGFGFDFLLSFPVAPPAARFNDSLVAVFTLTGGSITEASFNFPNANDGFVAAAHLHGIACTPASQSADCFPDGVFDPNATTSGAADGDDGFPPIPEPGAAALLSLALVGLAWAGKSRRS
jgi:hypothetical protein